MILKIRQLTTSRIASHSALGFTIYRLVLKLQIENKIILIMKINYRVIFRKSYRTLVVLK